MLYQYNAIDYVTDKLYQFVSDHEDVISMTVKYSMLKNKAKYIFRNHKGRSEVFEIDGDHFFVVDDVIGATINIVTSRLIEEE